MTPLKREAKPLTGRARALSEESRRVSPQSTYLTWLNLWKPSSPIRPRSSLAPGCCVFARVYSGPLARSPCTARAFAHLRTPSPPPSPVLRPHRVGTRTVGVTRTALWNGTRGWTVHIGPSCPPRHREHGPSQPAAPARRSPFCPTSSGDPGPAHPRAHGTRCRRSVGSR